MAYLRYCILNDATPSCKVRFFKISLDMLLMYGNIILSIMRNSTIFISIQNQQHRMSYDYSNQLYNSIYLILITRIMSYKIPTNAISLYCLSSPYNKKSKVNHFCKCTQSPISMLSMQLPSNQISIFGRSDGWLKETEILSDARVKWFPGGELKYSSNYIAHYVHNLSSRFKFRLTVEYMVQNKGCWVK